jgi:hypothetical protein
MLTGCKTDHFVVQGRSIYKQKRRLPFVTLRGKWHDTRVQCCSCRRYRVVGIWQERPVYAQDKTSHTVCPMCMSTLYPEQWERLKELRGVA